MAFKQAHEKGFSLVLALIIVAIITIFVAATITILRYNTKQSNQLIWRERLHRMANEGYINSLAQISSDPSLDFFDDSEKQGEWGVYRSTAMYTADMGTLFPGSDVDQVPELTLSIYLVTTATITVSKVKENRFMRLETYLRVADAGRYFLASAGEITISARANIPAGDIYGQSLVVNYNSAIPLNPLVRNLYFTDLAVLVDKSDQFALPEPLVANADYSEFFTEPPPNNMGRVVRLAQPPIFPQVSQSTLERLRDIASAGPHISTYTATSYPGNVVVFPDHIVGWKSPDDKHIYPPGCTTPSCGGVTNEQLKNHVYYVEGDLNIQGIVHGQLLFVATGDITIIGDLVSDSLTWSTPGVETLAEEDSPNIVYPGCPSPCFSDPSLNVGVENASIAHQAVLITPSQFGVRIDNTGGNPPTMNLYPDVGVTPGDPGQYLGDPVLTIEALIMAPNGGVRMTNPGANAEPADFYLNFKGGLILGSQVAWSTDTKYPPNDGSEYMNSLGKRPPPYLPGFTELQIWRETYN